MFFFGTHCLVSDASAVDGGYRAYLLPNSAQLNIAESETIAATRLLALALD